jgi:hypothetical protein
MELSMTISVLKYTREITFTIRDAKRQGAISQCEANYLHRMVENSAPASSTLTLVTEKGVPDFLYAALYFSTLIWMKGVPDFLYAALYFSTLIWMSGEAGQRDADARAGYKLAHFALQKELPAHDPYWAAKLLQELYDSHEESMQYAVTAA